MLQILNLSVASKKIGIPLPAFRNFYHPALFPFKILRLAINPLALNVYINATHRDI